jgi:hypothetical protein
MSNGAGAAAVAAAHQAMVNAVKASGTLVRVEPEAFAMILSKVRDALVVHAEGGLFSTNYQYLTSYKGLTFFTKSPQPLSLPGGCEVVVAKKIWMPD